jgi:hypothetical protein
MDKQMKQYIAIGHYVLLAIFLFYPLCSFATSNFEIIPKQRVFVAQERGIVTLPFTLNNRSTKRQYLIEAVDLPAGWKQLSSNGLFSLEGGESTVRLIHLLATSDVSSGRYAITYRIKSKHNNIYTKQTITVVIKSNLQLSIDIIEQPRLVLAGETYVVRLKLKNKGNTALALTIKANDRLDYLVSFSPKKLMLKPSELSVITFSVIIPNTIKNSLLHRVTLSFRSDSLYIEKTVKIKIIPRIPVGIGQYHTLSTVSGVNYATNSSVSTLQTEFKATGSLDRKGKHYIDLLFQNEKNNNGHSSALLSLSEQRIRYKNEKVDFHLGDRSFSVGGITDTGFYAKGIEVNLHPIQKAWAIRAFTAKKNQQGNVSNTTKISLKGAEISYQLPNEIMLSANILRTTDHNHPLLNETTWGLNAKWHQYDTLNIDFSYAQDNDGTAYRVQQDGRLSDDFHYTIEVQRASATFDGAIKDRQSESINSTYLFDNNKKYFRLGLLHHRNNLAHDPQRQILEEKEARFGMGYYFENDHRESFYAESFVKQRQDKRIASDLKQKNIGLHLEYKKYLNEYWESNHSLGYRQIDDQIKNKKSIETKQNITLSYAPNHHYKMLFNIDALQFYDDKKNSVNYGLNASARFTQQHSVSGYWRHASHLNSDTLQINYAYDFNKKGRMTLSMLKEKNTHIKNDTRYLLGLSIPLDIPLYRYDDIATIRGRVIDSKRHQAIANVIINIAGQSAVSDREGNYIFKSIQAGLYGVNVDLSKVKKQNYLLDDEQKNIKIDANKTTTHTIMLSQGAGLTGHIIKYQGSNKSIIEKNDDELSPFGGIEGLLVSLVSTDTTQIVHKTLSLEKGYFNFAGIKAGRWNVQVSDPKRKMEGFRIERATRLINVIEGVTQNLHFKAMPFIKTIKKIGPSNGFSVSSE